MEIDSAVIQVCAPEWYKWHFGKEHIDHRRLCWNKGMILHVDQSCCLVRTERSMTNTVSSFR